MVYAYQYATNNTAWAEPYLPLLQKYANYCLNNGLYPASQQSSTDSIAPAANQTILSTSCAIALTAFGALSGQTNYTTFGKKFAAAILELGLDGNRTHFLIHYDDPAASWATMYPLAFDRLVGLDTFDTSVAAMQSEWYARNEHPLGMQLTSQITYTLLEWECWVSVPSASSP